MLAQERGHGCRGQGKRHQNGAKRTQPKKHGGRVAKWSSAKGKRRKFRVRGRGGINGRMGHMVRPGDAMSTKAMLKQLGEQFPDYPAGEE